MRSAIERPHLVRYGTAADQKYLVGEFLETYDQLVVNANMLAHMPSALTTFISQHTKRKPYFVDPLTHAFQHDLSHLSSKSGRLKRSIEKLLDAYGSPVAKRVREGESVLPRDFPSSKIRKGFCERVLQFQWEAITAEAKDSPTAKYYKFLAAEKGLDLGKMRPSLLVAPYFYLAASTLDSWLPLNVDCANESKAIAKTYDVPWAVEIVVSKDILAEPSLRQNLIEKYSGINPDVFLLWIDDFDEQSASRSLLKSFVDVVNGLGASSRVVNLYGGFFSVALSLCGIAPLHGVCHGLEYGESRAVVPVGGGIPVAKYYLPVLHERLAYRDAFRAAERLGGMKTREGFLERVCSCRQCKKVIRSDDPSTDFLNAFGASRPVSFGRGEQVVRREFPLPATKDNSVRHYMWRKADEYSATASKQMVNALREGRSALEQTLGLEAVAHCSVWADVLAEVSAQ
jgi:hypothetical protein